MSVPQLKTTVELGAYLERRGYRDLAQEVESDRFHVEDSDVFRVLDGEDRMGPQIYDGLESLVEELEKSRMHGRFGNMEVNDGDFVIYDRNDPDTYIQSDFSVEI